MEKKIRIEKTKKGFPAYWEAGGGYTNIGNATVIADANGQPKKAVYVRRRGSLANAHHALIILGIGDHIIKADHHREDFRIEISKIVGFENDQEEKTFAILEQINCFNKGEWNTELPTCLEAAIQAAMEKATCYHCREPHFIIKEELR